MPIIQSRAKKDTQCQTALSHSQFKQVAISPENSRDASYFTNFPFLINNIKFAILVRGNFINFIV
jgi:hypothetical protein